MVEGGIAIPARFIGRARIPAPSRTQSRSRERRKYRAETIVVDDPVAVVVEAIACLTRRENLTGARAPPGRTAGLTSAAADPYAVGAHGAAIAPSCGTECTRTPVVDDTIAIVVEAITDLDDGQDLTSAGTPRTGETSSRPGSTRSYTSCSGGTVVAAQRRDRIVDQSITVVVDPVADLACRRRAGATHTAGDAIQRSGGAGADAFANAHA